MLKRTLCTLTAIIFLGVCALSQATDPPPASFDEKLGADDGAALAILFSANQRGNLDLCD